MPGRIIAICLLALVALPTNAPAGDEPMKLLGDHDITAGGYSLLGMIGGAARAIPSRKSWASSMWTTRRC